MTGTVPHVQCNRQLGIPLRSQPESPQHIWSYEVNPINPKDQRIDGLMAGFWRVVLPSVTSGTRLPPLLCDQARVCYPATWTTKEP